MKGRRNITLIVKRLALSRNISCFNSCYVHSRHVTRTKESQKDYNNVGKNPIS